MKEQTKRIFFCGVLHAGHCTDDLASVDFIIYVARSPKWLYDGGAPVARIAENDVCGSRNRGICARSLTSFRVTNLPMELRTFQLQHVFSHGSVGDDTR